MYIITLIHCVYFQEKYPTYVRQHFRRKEEVYRMSSLSVFFKYMYICMCIILIPVLFSVVTDSDDKFLTDYRSKR